MNSPEAHIRLNNTNLTSHESALQASYICPSYVPKLFIKCDTHPWIVFFPSIRDGDLGEIC